MSDLSREGRSALPAMSQSLAKWFVPTVRGTARRAYATTSAIFGFGAIVFLMSIVATIPVIQLLTLGYLLEAGARVARSGRLRDGFIGIASFRRVAGILMGAYLLLVPVRVLADFCNSAALLEANNPQRLLLTLGTATMAFLVAGHIAWAIYRGGRIRALVWPSPVLLARQLWSVGPRRTYAQSRDRVWDAFESMQLPYFAWLGVCGFVIAISWLAVPVTLLVAASRLAEGPATFLSLVGGTLLLAVLFYLPFFQLNFARTRVFRNGFCGRLVRAQFQRAPVAFGFALVITLVLSVPLYVLKAEWVPREAAWLPSLAFVLFILPARILTGWAIWRAEQQNKARRWFARWAALLLALPVVVAYVLIVFLTQYTSWQGVWSLYEQHSFLLPIPFVGI